MFTICLDPLAQLCRTDVAELPNDGRFLLAAFNC